MKTKRAISFTLVNLTLFLLLAALYRNGQAAPTATTYYVCDCQPGADGDCAAGSDANSGTDPAAPWQTYEQARTQFNSGSAGDEIRFCRGGAFDLGSGGSSRWTNNNCTAAEPCVVADYTPPWATGDEGRPILSRPSDEHVFELANSGDAVTDGGYTFQNLDLRCPGCTDAGWGFFLFNDVNDVLIDNVSMDEFAIGIHLAGSNSCAAGDAQCNGQNDRITIRNVNIVNSLHQGILGGGNELLIENSYFENNGDGSVFDHNIYLSGGSGITVRNNELYRSSLDVGGSCGGVSLVGHGQMVNLLIEGNYVHEDVGKANQTCWGIAISPAYDGTPESYNNLIIRGNRVENVGNVSIATGSCLNCTIENNVVVQQQPFGTTGIAVRPFAAAEDAISSNITVRNNSIATTTGVGIEVNEGSGHTIVSNAIQATGSNVNWNCFDMTLAAGSYDVIDYNVCGFSAGSWATTAANLATWQALGWGANSSAGTPGFMSSTDLRAGSETAVIVNAGHPTLSSTVDFLGNGRDALPDVGAYEWLGDLATVFLPFVLR
ncbi:MAG: hypothetical protein CL608_00735 [Anaerolineaceae bacterium]|nr:hypothetical protein [Anaerolineaceae bacterium]